MRGLVLATGSPLEDEGNELSDRRNTPDPQLPQQADGLDFAEMTAEQLAEAKRYGRQKLVCGLTGRLINLVFLGVMTVAFARPIDAWLSGFVARESLRLVVFFSVLVALLECLSLPLAFYSGHVLEHRYGLSNQSLAKWLIRHLKGFGLGSIFGIVMVLGLYWVIWLTESYWWMVAAGAYFIVSVLLGQLAPVLILPIFYKIERLENAELTDRMSRLAEGTGLSIEGVYRMKLSDETVKANAMLAGLGRTRRVILGDTLIAGFTAEEIEVIFAHEVGHHVFGHISKMMIAGIWYSVVGFWVCHQLLLSYIDAGVFQYSSMPVYVLPLLMLVLSVFFMLVEPVQNFISRRYERQCDRYALKRTGLYGAYVSAFRKLAKVNKDDPSPNPVEVFLFHSHPPIAQRLALAED